MSRFYVQNFGCRATQADGAAIEPQFLDEGLRPAPDSAEAGIVVITTCTATAQADRDARRATRWPSSNRASRRAYSRWLERAGVICAAPAGAGGGYREMVSSGIRPRPWGRG